MTTSSPASAASEYDRLPMDARTYEEVWQYYVTRALQFASVGFFWNQKLEPVDGGYVTWFTDGTEDFASFYVVQPERGNRKAVAIAASIAPARILTMEDCGVSHWFRDRSIPYVMAKGIYDTREYREIHRMYKSNRAKRSRVHLMNHIDEGLYIMSKLGASVQAQKAFCLHPLLQADDDLAANFFSVQRICDPIAVALALEYRNQANLWLSDKVSLMDLHEVSLRNGKPTAGPLEGVRLMLIADKVQNYKDFVQHHQGKHARSPELDRYFKRWLEELGVDNFQEWVDDINSLTNPT